MFILYRQSTGDLYLGTGELHGDFTWVARGYSGRDRWTNDPRSDGLAGSGPLPRGEWTTGEAFLHARLGPVCIPLQPSPLTDAKGRSGFFIHGDNSRGDRSASSGCIIVGRSVREMIAQYKGATLAVIA